MVTKVLVFNIKMYERLTGAIERVTNKLNTKNWNKFIVIGLYFTLVSGLMYLRFV